MDETRGPPIPSQQPPDPLWMTRRQLGIAISRRILAKAGAIDVVYIGGNVELHAPPPPAGARISYVVDPSEVGEKPGFNVRLPEPAGKGGTLLVHATIDFLSRWTRLKEDFDRYLQAWRQVIVVLVVPGFRSVAFAAHPYLLPILANAVPKRGFAAALEVFEARDQPRAAPEHSLVQSMLAQVDEARRWWRQALLTVQDRAPTRFAALILSAEAARSNRARHLARWPDREPRHVVRAIEREIAPPQGDGDPALLVLRRRLGRLVQGLIVAGRDPIDVVYIGGNVAQHAPPHPPNAAIFHVADPSEPDGRRDFSVTLPECEANALVVYATIDFLSRWNRLEEDLDRYLSAPRDQVVLGLIVPGLQPLEFSQHSYLLSILSTSFPPRKYAVGLEVFEAPEVLPQVHTTPLLRSVRLLTEDAWRWLGRSWVRIRGEDLETPTKFSALAISVRRRDQAQR